MRLGNLVLLCFSVMASGCAVVSSSDVNPSTIYSQYSADYDEAADKLHFNASFFVGGDTGTYVELAAKSSVTVNSEPMVKNRTIFNQIIYEREMFADSQSLSSAHTFTYVNDAGDVYQNSVQIPGRVSATAPQYGSASIAAGFSITWQSTTTVGRRESVRAVLKSADTIVSQSSWSGGRSGQIAFSPQTLNGFKPGAATISVCRESFTTSIRGTAAGGSMSVSYCSTPVNVTLTQ